MKMQADPLTGDVYHSGSFLVLILLFILRLSHISTTDHRFAQYFE
jgi:hypothetical protein